ncbi:MAG: helix-hairpin-helix domain-containing protein [Mariprofundaceae bacterium]|nr:helix-hairpin-helix domain-containing protein [Mariprofundaceae bacterium]
MKNILTAIVMAVFMVIGSAWAGDMVNINTASNKELQKVHGIGAKTAAMIVSYRDEHGAFKSVKGLLKVKGIGKKTLEKIDSELSTGDTAE